MSFQGPFQLDVNALEVSEKGSSFYESYVDPIWGGSLSPAVHVDSLSQGSSFSAKWVSALAAQMFTSSKQKLSQC